MKNRILTIFTILAILLPLMAFPQAASAATPVSIYDIQYTTDSSGDSPYTSETVTTQGVVTAVFGSNYVWIQDGSGPWSGLYIYKLSNFN